MLAEDEMRDLRFAAEQCRGSRSAETDDKDKRFAARSPEQDDIGLSHGRDVLSDSDLD